MTFLLALIAYVSVAGIVSILVGGNYGWFGALILALFPRFWGYSLINTQEIPFASLFTLATFLGACLIGYYANVDTEAENLKLGENKLTLYSILYGILAGLATGLRGDGFWLVLFLMFAHLLSTRIGVKPISLKVARFSKFYLLIILAWALTTSLVYLVNGDNPLQWLKEVTLSPSTSTFLDKSILFDGRNIPVKFLPWYYVPRMISLTVPILFQLTFALGLLWLLFRYHKLREIQRACVVLTILQIFLIPLVVIVTDATTYDGIEYFLFILPGMAAISATTLLWIYQKLPNKHFKIFAIVFLLIQFSPIVIDMIRLHPYQYVYFNRTYGGLSVAQQQQETEYWELGLREGMEWLNKNAPANSTIVVGGKLSVAQSFADSSLNFRLISFDDFQRVKMPTPDYYLTMTLGDYHQGFPTCPIVYSVERQKTSLTIIKHCQPSSATKNPS